MRKLVGVMLCSMVFACADADVPLFMEQFQWKKRVVVMLADASDNAALQQMEAAIANDPEGWKERDMAAITVVRDAYVEIEAERKAHLPTRPFYDHFKPESPFTAILIGKDGLEKLRSTEAITLEKLYETIDAMPMRQREMEPVR